MLDPCRDQWEDRAVSRLLRIRLLRFARRSLLLASTAAVLVGADPAAIASEGRGGRPSMPMPPMGRSLAPTLSPGSMLPGLPPGVVQAIMNSLGRSPRRVPAIGPVADEQLIAEWPEAFQRAQRDLDDADSANRITTVIEYGGALVATGLGDRTRASSSSNATPGTRRYRARLLSWGRARRSTCGR